MTEEIKASIYGGVDLNCKTNNTLHHTSEISVDQLIVRRGQPFNLSLKLVQPFNPDLHPLFITAMTGNYTSEEQGTISFFGIPDHGKRSPSAKAVWKIELHQSSSLLQGILNLTITPPADTPIGEYTLCVTHRDEETLLAILFVLFNPWCPDDWVFLSDEEERQEYVMNEEGVIYRGSGNYIFPMQWDFGQFEDSMVNICMKILDLNHKHMEDPADDISARCNPIYVSRVISAMVNNEDDRGILMGRWSGPYWGGVQPSHWNGSHTILKQWFNRDCYPVKYGQCWVFAGVMCSVMRFLGIPCRVVTNFESAHDNNRNLIIDVYHADYGVEEKTTHDSVWNYHVWVEGWMRRPDLSEDGKYDGWQVLDPTPQEQSDGVYCCGPAPVKAILDGETNLKYDIPFVYAEVNADCIDWLVKKDGSLVKIWSDTKKVGQNISTKSVHSDKRLNITDTYKHREGSDKERSVFQYACTRDYSRVDKYAETEEYVDDAEMEEYVDDAETEEYVDDAETEEYVDDAETEEYVNDAETEEYVNDAETEEYVDDAETEGNEAINETTYGVTPPRPKVSLRIEEVSKPENGKDVSLKLVVHSKNTVAMPLSINISVQAMRHNGTPAVNIQTELKEEILQPGKDLSIPILVPFLAYNKSMLDCEGMKVSAVIIDKQNPDNPYLAEDDVVLLDPPISVTVSGQPRLNLESKGEVVFMNPINQTLTNCTLTLSGSGLWREELECKLSDMKPNTRIIIRFNFVPYKTGKKTLVATFDCSTFRDIKGCCTFNVKP